MTGPDRAPEPVRDARNPRVPAAPAGEPTAPLDRQLVLRRPLAEVAGAVSGVRRLLQPATWDKMHAAFAVEVRRGRRARREELRAAKKLVRQQRSRGSAA